MLVKVGEKVEAVFRGRCTHCGLPYEQDLQDQPRASHKNVERALLDLPPCSACGNGGYLITEWSSRVVDVLEEQPDPVPEEEMPADGG